MESAAWGKKLNQFWSKGSRVIAIFLPKKVAKKVMEHCKKRLRIFLSPAGMSLTKLSLAGNNLIFPGQSEFG
jgi:hypothetical protein